MLTIDARGLSCPIPVMRTEEAIVDGIAEFIVLVDSGTARQNVSNQLKDAGYNLDVSEDRGAWAISAKRG